MRKIVVYLSHLQSRLIKGSKFILYPLSGASLWGGVCSLNKNRRVIPKAIWSRVLCAGENLCTQKSADINDRHWANYAFDDLVWWTLSAKYKKHPAKLEVPCYLGGLLTAFDLVDAGLSQSDPVSNTLQLAPVLLHTVGHPGRNTHTLWHQYGRLLTVHNISETMSYNSIGMSGQLLNNLRGPIPNFFLHMHIAGLLKSGIKIKV